jgi:carboxyl-terminal processing protease
MTSRFAGFRLLLGSYIASLAIVAVGIAGTIVGTVPVAAQEAQAPKGLQPPSARDTQVAKIVSYLMPRNHVSGSPLDDKISGRSLDLFIEALDPLKMYFYQSDVEDFNRYRNMIDDMVQNGDLTAAYTIFNRFMQRIDERRPTIAELLDGGFDFTENEKLVTDPDLLNFPATPAEAKDRWKLKLKYDLLVLKDAPEESIPGQPKVQDDKKTPDAKDLPAYNPEAVDKLKRRYARYADRWKQVDNDDLLQYFLTSVTTAYDPHSTYMSPSSLDDFEISMSLNLDGIGAQLTEKDGATTITRIIPGGAAAKDGKLKTNDVIVGVGQGTDGKLVDVVEMPLDDVVKLIRGPAGTQVRLAVKSSGVSSVEELLITRARIELGESAARGEIIEHAVGDGEPKLRIGYINLPSFYSDMNSAKNNVADFRSSTRDVRKILDGFREQKVDGVVLDLSRNGGGSLTEAIGMTGLFIDRGVVVQVKNPSDSVQEHPDEDLGTSWDGPLVVLTSKLSASASEILAGAIRDYHRGIVVGDPATHGKGSVQTLMDLGERLLRTRRANFGALKVTIQQFYLPDGESTQLQGVPADVVLPSLIAKMDISEGDLKYALDFDRVPSSRHMVYNQTPPGLVDELRRNSLDRVAKDEEFLDMTRRIDLFVKQKENKEISLNEEEFLARREELNAQKEEEEELFDQQLETEEVYNDNYYNREVLSVTYDYIQGLRKQNLALAR